MSNKIIQLNEDAIKGELKELVRNSVEETLNNLLDQEAKELTQTLREMKLKEAAAKVEASIEETLTYMSFPSEHWIKIRTNNVIERLNREIRRRTRVVGTFPDGNSALMLVCARLRHVAGTQWGSKKYMSMKHFEPIYSEE
jgi:transposase-like protein